MILRRSCKQIAALLGAREDRALALADRVALRMHLVECNCCPALEQQLVRRAAMRRWRSDRGGPA